MYCDKYCVQTLLHTYQYTLMNLTLRNKQAVACVQTRCRIFGGQEIPTATLMVWAPGARCLAGGEERSAPHLGAPTHSCTFESHTTLSSPALDAE